jgi:hypothetical protein
MRHRHGHLLLIPAALAVSACALYFPSTPILPQTFEGPLSASAAASKRHRFRGAELSGRACSRPGIKRALFGRRSELVLPVEVVHLV